MNWVLLKNSLLVSGFATVMAVLLGSAVALGLACVSRGWRQAGWVASIVALALPPFLVTGAWIDLLGQTGVLRRWVPFDIYAMGGTVWVLALLFWPVTTLLVGGALTRLDRELIDSGSELGGFNFIRQVVFPFVRSSLALAAVLTFVLALNQFSVPAILQTKVYPAEVWLRFNTAFDHWGALRASWPLVLAPLALLWWSRGREWPWPVKSPEDTAALLRERFGRIVSVGLWVAGLLVLALAVCLPLAVLVMASRTWAELGGALAAGQGAIVNSLMFAGVTATVVCVVGLLAGRWRSGGLLWLVFLAPGVLLGVGLILLLNRPSLAWLYQGSVVVLLALGLRYLAIGRSGGLRALDSLNRELTEAARLAGASGWRLFREVHWPQMAAPLLAVWYAVYVLCLWDVETLVLIIPPGGETLALRIFNLLHYGHNAQVNALCVALLGLAIAPLLAWIGWQRLSENRNKA